MRVERVRDNVFTVTATGPELSALVAAARMALDALRGAPDPPQQALEVLARVLDDFDRARNRAEAGGADDAGGATDAGDAGAPPSDRP